MKKWLKILLVLIPLALVPFIFIRLGVSSTDNNNILYLYLLSNDKSSSNILERWTYNGRSIDGSQDIFPDESNTTLLPSEGKWDRVTSGSPNITVNSGNHDLIIEDDTHAEFCYFKRESSYLNDSYSETTAMLNVTLKVDLPSGNSDFWSGTLGIFLEIDDGTKKIFMCLLNEDFDGGSDPMVGIADSSGSLDQYSTYQNNLYQVYWEDGGYHTFEMTRESNGSATLIVDGDISNAIGVSKSNLPASSGIPLFAFGTAQHGISTSYWDEVTFEVRD